MINPEQHRESVIAEIYKPIYVVKVYDGKNLPYEVPFGLVESTTKPRLTWHDKEHNIRESLFVTPENMPMVQAHAYFIQRVKLVKPHYILIYHFPHEGGIYKFAASYGERENITVCQTTQFDIFITNRNYPNFKPNFIYEAK